MPDRYVTLRERLLHSIKVERSEFIAIAFPVPAEDGFFEELTRIEKEYHDATHHCWAFRLFDEGRRRSRSSDAGEPGGTAGRPILHAIESAKLEDIGVVVVRYYGGIKLGTGGLARAYRDAAVATLGDVQRVDRFVYERLIVTVPFAMMSTIYRLVNPPAVLLVGESFGETNEYSFDVQLSAVGEFTRQLAGKRLEFRR